MNCQKEKFQLRGKATYLNCAYMSPQLKKVENAGRKALTGKRQPYLIKPEDFFHDSQTLRSLFSKLVNSAEPGRVVIIPSVSYGMANAAQNLKKKKGNVIVASEQFPSNIYAWQTAGNYELKIISPDSGKKREESWNAKILEAINEQTAAVALGHVHWVYGSKFDLKAIREKAHQCGAALIVDGTQSVGALPFDVTYIQPDALICAGYKWLMGPYAIGLAYYGSYFDGGKPIEDNWINRANAEDFGGLINYTQEYQPGAQRYEMGERSNFFLVPMMIAALKQLLDWQPAEIQAYCEQLIDDIAGELIDMGYSIENKSDRCSHLVGIVPPSGSDMAKIKSTLDQNKVFVSIRGHAIRIAPHVYNTEKDMRKLVRVLKSAQKQ